MSLPKTFKTEKEAVYHAMLLWEFLKDNPTASKWEYEKKHKVATNPHGEYWLSGCPCCEYYIPLNVEKGLTDHYDGIKNIRCTGCSLDTDELCRFNKYNSAYHLWRVVTGKERKKYANIIYKALVKAYKKLSK